MLELDEFTEIEHWAENEDWNPGKHETKLLNNNESFTCKGAIVSGALVASLVLTHHTKHFKFLGYFIVES